MKNNDLTLVVMAAGMGSRFGGLKQIEPIGPNGEFITDYSIYDAIIANFKKVVFIIKEENLSIFKETIGKRIEGKIEVEYAFQGADISYQGEVYTREKPWGTAHAVLCAKDVVEGNFMVINSDDFYGRDAYLVGAKFFENNTEDNNFGLVGYQVINTLTENGSVKRGVCKVEGNYLKTIIESKVEIVDDSIVAAPLNGDPTFNVSKNDVVSMNMFLFTPYVFELFEEYLKDFVENINENYESCEYLIPDVIQKAIDEDKINMEVLSTTAKWEGVTYKEDKEGVVAAIRKMIEEGIYEENLWQK